MSKSIKIDPSFIESAKADFLKMIEEGKFADGNITFNRKFVGETNKKAKLFIEKLAWDKMRALVEEFKTEIGWHGLARRGENEGEYYLDDIIVYPQVVTGATVTPDQVKYQNWLYDLPDEDFNKVRFQGHSHVNMGTSPSGTDRTYYQSILEQCSDDMFYIFAILNKKGERHIEIFDLAINTIFDTSDITVTLLIDPNDPVEQLVKDAKSKVEEYKPPVTTYAGTKYYSSYAYGNYNYGKGGGGVATGKSSTTPKKPIVDADSLPGLSSEEYKSLISDPLAYY